MQLVNHLAGQFLDLIKSSRCTGAFALDALVEKNREMVFQGSCLGWAVDAIRALAESFEGGTARQRFSVQERPFLRPSQATEKLTGLACCELSCDLSGCAYFDVGATFLHPFEA